MKRLQDHLSLSFLMIFSDLQGVGFNSDSTANALTVWANALTERCIKYIHMIFVIGSKANVIPNKTFLYIFICYIASWCLFLFTLFEYRNLLFYGVALFLIVTVSMEAPSHSFWKE